MLVFSVLGVEESYFFVAQEATKALSIFSEVRNQHQGRPPFVPPVLSFRQILEVLSHGWSSLKEEKAGIFGERVISTKFAKLPPLASSRRRIWNGKLLSESRLEVSLREGSFDDFRAS